MKVTQAYEIINKLQKQVFGTEEVSPITGEQDIIDLGNKLDNLDVLDTFMKQLINHIGKVIFDVRVYAGQAPSVYMDGTEYGSIVEKVRCEVPTARKNSSWDLKPNYDFNDSKYYCADVKAKYFNEMDTWEVPMSFAYLQVKQSFGSAAQLTAFFTMIENKIEMAITINNENLVMATIRNFMAATIHTSFSSDLSGDYSGHSSVKAVNLLHEAKEAKIVAESMTAEQALKDLGFLKYAAFRIATYSDYLTRASKMFNIGGTTKFTPREMQRMVLLSDFARAADTFLQSDTFHNEFTRLPKADHVSFWQGSGSDYSFGSLSDIHMNIKNPLNVNDGTIEEVVVSGVLGCLFDREALGVTNMNRRVRTKEVPEAEFYTNFYKVDARYFNDYDENFVVFFVN